MLEQIIDELDLHSIKKTTYMKMARTFQERLPDSLYMNPYELAGEFHGSVQDWRDFLKVPEIYRYIESEIGMIAEIGARSALKNLQKSGATSQDISAAKELLVNSKLLKQKNNQHKQIVLTRIPAKEEVR